LPPEQGGLEADYRRFLGERFGVVFTRLYALANMPIARFGSTLVSKGQFRDYMAKLRAAHRPQNVGQVMCRTLVSVDWQGFLYDCDFNQMLGLSSCLNGTSRPHLRDLLAHDPAGARRAASPCTRGTGPC
jgi:hypothetical protein